jgi:thiamine-phosphate pyrophosphorylase
VTGPLLRPRLIAITDTHQGAPDAIEARSEALLSSAVPGSVLLQLRCPELTARERLALGRRLQALTRRYAQHFAVNDRLDLAVLLRADAVHLGEQSVTTSEARGLVGAAWISRACHDVHALREVDADAVLLSPVLAARKQAPALGLAALSDAVARAKSGARPKLLYALGGVTAESARSCIDAGADGVAAIGAIFTATDPAPLLAALGIRRA